MEHHEAKDEEMEERQDSPWMGHGMHHAGGERGWKKCGCPMCRGIRAMHKMGMVSGGFPGMTRGMMPGMEPGMAPWRKFISSDEKIAMLEKYLKDLQSEEKGVMERIEHIHSKYQK
jgi:hypothetical protein